MAKSGRLYNAQRRQQQKQSISLTMAHFVIISLNIEMKWPSIQSHNFLRRFALTCFHSLYFFIRSFAPLLHFLNPQKQRRRMAKVLTNKCHRNNRTEKKFFFFLFSINKAKHLRFFGFNLYRNQSR